MLVYCWPGIRQCIAHMLYAKHIISASKGSISVEHRSRSYSKQRKTDFSSNFVYFFPSLMLVNLRGLYQVYIIAGLSASINFEDVLSCKRPNENNGCNKKINAIWFVWTTQSFYVRYLVRYFSQQDKLVQ